MRSCAVCTANSLKFSTGKRTVALPYEVYSRADCCSAIRSMYSKADCCFAVRSMYSQADCSSVVRSMYSKELRKILADPNSDEVRASTSPCWHDSTDIDRLLCVHALAAKAGKRKCIGACFD